MVITARPSSSAHKIFCELKKGQKVLILRMKMEGKMRANPYLRRRARQIAAARAQASAAMRAVSAQNRRLVQEFVESNRHGRLAGVYARLDFEDGRQIL